MVNDGFEIQALTNLGLTSVQARVYLTLVKYGVSKISDVSRQSDVGRTEVYRSLNQLYDLGLVEKVLRAPVEYKALPLEEGIEALLNKKQIENEKLQHEAKLLLRSFEVNPLGEQQVDSDFIMLSKKGAIITMGQQNIDDACVRFDFLVTWKRFLGGMCDVYFDNLLKAHKRGVKGRFLVQKPSSDVNINTGRVAKLMSIFEVKFISHVPHTLFGIVDGQKGYIIINPTPQLTGTCGIWTNNPSLLALVQEYFERLWLGE